MEKSKFQPMEASENMSTRNNNGDLLIEKELKKLSDKINASVEVVSIILAAGHGKRLKSEKPKMLHEIWGKPTVYRVSEAATEGLGSNNQIIVVGKKALQVARALGKKEGRVFVYQKDQRGTGDAVRVALDSHYLNGFNGQVYIFPGDMGLLTKEMVKDFKNKFEKFGCDMMVMTGIYEDDPQSNYYGRILKDPETSQIIDIKEFKDIIALPDDQNYIVESKGKRYSFSKNELLRIGEFNAGVYGFRIEPLKRLIAHIKPDNVQGEIYITDLIKIFNDNGLKVCTSAVEKNDYILGFNVKSVLKKMETTFRDMVYEKLKDIVLIDDPEDFFIAEETVNRIIELDKKYPALDIRIGKGAYIGKGVFLNRGLEIGKNTSVTGNVIIGENVKIGESVVISTYSEQKMTIGDNVQILNGNVLQGNIEIGPNVRIETGVRITGSDEYPVRIGSGVLIKGTTYIFGSIIEEDLLIEHSILKNKYVEKVVKKNGKIQPIRYILPHPEGLDSIRDIE